MCGNSFLFVLQNERNHFPAGDLCPSELLPGSGKHLLLLLTLRKQWNLLMFILRSVLQSETEAEESVTEEEHVELFTTAQTKMGAATSDFGYNLFRALASQEAGNNVFLAPISVSAVLTQLSMGDNTNPETKFLNCFNMKL